MKNILIFTSFLMMLAACTELTSRECFLRGIEKAEKGNFTGAKKDFTKGIRLAPDLPDGYMLRASAKHGLLDYMGAIEDLTIAIKLDTAGTFDLYHKRGTSKADLGDSEGAIDDLTRAIEMNPYHADAFYNRGTCRMKLNDDFGAIADFDSAVNIDPAYANAYINRGISKKVTGDYSGAIDDFDLFLSFVPSDRGAISDKADTKYRSGDFEGALEDYNQLFLLGHDDYKTRYHRGITYLELEEYRAAIIDLSKAIDQIKKNDQMYIDALMARGRAKRREKDFRGAVRDYNTVISMQPSNHKAYNDRGVAFINMDERFRAMADFYKVIELVPDNIDAWFNRALLRYEMKNYYGVVADANQAISLDSTYADFYWLRGVATVLLGDKEIGCQDLYRAVDMGSWFAFEDYETYCFGNE